MVVRLVGRDPREEGWLVKTSQTWLACSSEDSLIAVVFLRFPLPVNDSPNFYKSGQPYAKFGKYTIRVFRLSRMRTLRAMRIGDSRTTELEMLWPSSIATSNTDRIAARWNSGTRC